MVDNPPIHESCDPKGVKDSARIGNNEVEVLGEKSIEIEDDEESEEPEIIIDTVVNPFEVDDDTSSETSLRAVKLTRSAANESMRQALNNTSKPTEFVIVSTISESTVKFPDDVQIKDELAEPMATACSPNDDDALENDPMGLLEINDRSDVNSTRSNVEQDDVADDISSTCSSSIQTTSSVVNISDWAKDYPWLLHEECDEWYGYCLYCDVKLSVRSSKSCKHHGMSLYHRERCAHYLAFREEEEKNNLGTSVAEIKQEFGTDSYVAALKLKRKTQAEAFNNYNWRRWLEECPWLERDNSAGTIGHCKYCSVRLNVEFSYLRQRHQESGHHKERAKEHTKLNASMSHEVNEVNEEDEEYEATNASADRQADAEGDEDEQQTSKSDDLWCLEILDNRSARCTLCDTILKKRNSYKRHLQTQLHIHNEKNHEYVAQQKSKKSGKPSSQEGDDESTSSKIPVNSWQMYAQKHAWLTADPLDSSFAYCKYCKKRLNYGSSGSKRATHEQSYSHKANEKTYKESKEKDDNDCTAQANEEDESAIDGGDEDGDDEDDVESANVQEEEEKEDSESEQNEEASDEEEDQEDDADEEDENSEEEEEEKEDEEEEENEEDEEKEEEETNKKEANADEDDANKSKKRILSRNAAEWYNQFAWCKRYKKDSKYCYCSYCKLPITKGSRKKHGYSKKHIEAEKKVIKRKNRTETKKGAKEEDLFEWAVDIKAQPNLYYCKCCRVRISKHYSKKQHSVSKIHQINEKLYQNRKNAVQPGPETKTTQPATSSAQSSQQRNETPVLRKVVVKGQSFITSIKQWQKRYTWLGYKLSELRSNYAYCKPCEQSLYVRSFKNIIKHQRSSKHMRIVNQLKRDRQKDTSSIQVDKKTTKREVDQNSSTDKPTQRENSGELNNSTKDSAKGSSYKSTIETMQKRYSWITKASKPDHAYCRYCDEDVPLKIIFLRNHTNSRTHRRSVVNFGGTKTKTEKNQQDESNAADNEAEDDDDEAADVEAVDDEAGEDVVLLEDNAEEILISEQDDNWTVKSENMDEHEALDCLLQRAVKSGQTSNNANASRDERKQATTSDERQSKRFKRSHSFRRLNDSTSSSLISSILSTPLTLASCLGPLIQQQIQQATNLQQSSASPSTTTTSSAPEAPLPRTKEPENTYDLFFKSVSETIKKLPVDIAAEGKVKVMQIICDLELKALKRQQEQHYTLAIEQSVEQSNNTNLSSSPMMNAPYSYVMANSPTIGNRTNSNVVTNSSTTLNSGNCNSNEQRSETNGNPNRIIADNNSTTSASDQYMGETVITPIYGNVNTSPTNRQPHQQHYHKQIQQKPQQTSVSTINNASYASSSATNVTMDKNKSPNQAPIIGVMDMNGLQTLQLRNNPMVKQIPKQNVSANSGQPSGPTTSIRCIPFKNLTQNTSGDANAKITRIQVPMPATNTPTSQSSQNNASGITNATKGLLNLRSIHITKRTGTNPQQQQPQTASPVSVSVVNPITDKNPPPTYVQTSNMQRWTAVNGSINTIANKKPSQQCTTTTATFQVSAKNQNYTPINRNYK